MVQFHKHLRLARVPEADTVALSLAGFCLKVLNCIFSDVCSD